jgi:hypothetical protein
LSTPARHVRRATFEASALLESSTGTERWSRELLLATWEWPLKLLAAAAVTLAAGLLAMRW